MTIHMYVYGRGYIFDSIVHVGCLCVSFSRPSMSERAVSRYVLSLRALTAKGKSSGGDPVRGHTPMNEADLCNDECSAFVLSFFLCWHGACWFVGACRRVAPLEDQPCPALSVSQSARHVER